MIKSEQKEYKILIEAIEDEEEAIDTYHRLIAACDDDSDKKIYERILADEERHLAELEKLKVEENTESSEEEIHSR